MAQAPFLRQGFSANAGRDTDSLPKRYRDPGLQMRIDVKLSNCNGLCGSGPSAFSRQIWLRSGLSECSMEMLDMVDHFVSYILSSTFIKKNHSSPAPNKSEVCEGEKESAPASHSHSTADTLSVLHVGGGGGFGVPPVLCGQGTQEPPTILP